MKSMLCVGLLILLVVISGSDANSASEQAAWCGCSEINIAGRISAGFAEAPVPSGSFILEIGAGLPEFSLSAWANIDTFPSPTPSFGGRFSLTRDWLSLGLAIDHELNDLRAEVVVEAEPPSWLVYNSIPALVIGVTADLRACILGADAATEASVTPFLILLTPDGDSLLSTALGVDIQLDSTRQLLRIPASQISLSQDLGSLVVSASLGFNGVLASIASANLVVGLPDLGLTLSGALIPAGAGSYFYRVSITFQWGDAYLLPSRPERGGLACAGGVCY